MPTPKEQLAIVAVTPSATDIAIASEVILGAIGEGYRGTAELFAPVAERLATEPLPDVWTRLAYVEETEVRRVRSDATTMTAVAELEATGAILPIGRHDYYRGVWTLKYTTPRGDGGGYNVEGGSFNYGTAGGHWVGFGSICTRILCSPHGSARTFSEEELQQMGLGR